MSVLFSSLRKLDNSSPIALVIAHYFSLSLYIYIYIYICIVILLAIKGAPADTDTQARGLGPTLCNIWIWHFIMGGILWLYQTQGLFITCAPDTDMTDDSHSDCSLTVGHQKEKNPKF